jgi:hypothetical protein
MAVRPSFWRDGVPIGLATTGALLVPARAWALTGVTTTRVIAVPNCTRG